ncbi:MAG TPA: RluA family pseudouridine synthase [Acidimicrobiia bacterium]|nr:RluA family pseudouridine synthase [Acidimicrobiia bacterium]
MSDDAMVFVAPAALDGERVDRAVALITGWPRAAVQQLLDAGEVLVDGRQVAKSLRLQAGNEIEIRSEPAPDVPPTADGTVDVDVRYADDDVIVVAKPAGLVVHPGAGNADGTLVNGLLARFPELATVGDELRPGIVHRLDRETSGLLVVARSPHAYDALTTALAAREVVREYTALVWGHLDARRGVIDAPIGRSESRRTRMAVRGSGKDARTQYEVVGECDDPKCSLLTCRLETGRTHQIRVHLSAIGHPVVGDASYGGKRQSLPAGRPFLHAAHLEFAHPVSGQRLAFDDPLPPELQRVLDGLALRPM